MSGPPALLSVRPTQTTCQAVAGAHNDIMSSHEWQTRPPYSLRKGNTCMMTEIQRHHIGAGNPVTHKPFTENVKALLSVRYHEMTSLGLSLQLHSN